MSFSFRRALRGIAATLTVGLVAAGLAVTPSAADLTTVSVDNLRTGWDAREPGLSPSSVSASDFGQLFATKLDGQIYAQPVIAKALPSAKPVLLAVTEKNNAYGLDPVNGRIRWTRKVGREWPASAIGCGDLVPTIGITATPVVDPASGTAYFTAKVNDGKTANTPSWYFHAVDLTNGRERAGFPTKIAGRPSNDASHTFNAKTAMQRPGLLLLGGVVYAGFASHCDKGPYVGYIVGVDAKTGKQTAMWAAATGSQKAGIWQSGGGLVSDGPGRIIFATGNGTSPTRRAGTSPPASLGESVVRVQVKANRSLAAADFFSPVNNTNLDTDDTDLGSGGPLAIPNGYGTKAHPHLLVQVGKDGRVFLLDRDALGGTGQRAGKKDNVLQTAGPYKGVWGHPAFWGGGGGYVYTITNRGPLSAFKVGVSGSGLPALTRTGNSTGSWGYTSGSPVVTSDGTKAGSALVWGVYSRSANGAGGELRAYDATPVSGKLKQRYAARIGTAGKFTVPATEAGRVYVGNRTGTVYGFGRPTTAALAGTPTDFGLTPVKKTVTKRVTVTAARALTITAVSTEAPFTKGAVKLPVSLAAGAKLGVDVAFTPTTPQAVSAALSFTTSAGTFAFDLRGAGTRNGLLADPSALDFGQVPVGGNVTLAASIANSGATATVITGVTAPTGAFSADSLPVAGATLAPGASISVPVTFAPTAAGKPTSKLVVASTTGTVTVPLTGMAVTGAPRLTITPPVLDFGSVPVGTTLTKTFDIADTGNLLLTLSKAAPPTAPFLVPNPVSEGQSIEPGDVIHQSVTFAPTKAGPATGTYLITGNDGTGAKTVTIRGTGAAQPTPGRVVGLGGKCADVRGGRKANGTPVQLYGCNGSAAQGWTAHADGTLQSLGKCLDVKGGKTANGTKVQVWTCNGTTAQRWTPRADGSLLNARSAKCLDVPGAKAKNRVVLQVYRCNGSAAQRWTVPK